MTLESMDFMAFAETYLADENGEDASKVFNPATGEVIARFPIASDSDVDAAVQRASEAFKTWGSTSPAERAAVLLKIADAVEQEIDEFARIESLNVGLPIGDVRDFVVPTVVDVLRFFAGAARISTAPAVDEYDNESTSWVRREPLGVVGLITPWNYPLLMGAWKIAPALAAGNTMLLKPATVTPLSTLKLVEIANRFLPEGVINLILGSGSAGTAMAKHPGIRKIAFTGATSTGKFVAATAAETVKKVGLELGGKAPVLVFADSPIRKTARDLVTFGYSGAGQDCTAACRIIVEESVYEEFVEAYCKEVSELVLGDPSDPATTLGPVISEKQLKSVLGFIERAREAGNTIKTGGRQADRPGWFIEPTVIVDVKQTDEIVQSEVFGPVVSIQSAKSDDEMLQLANDVNYGLSASVWTTNLARTLRFTKELRFGTVWVNQHTPNVSEMPFGGYGESGYGRELSLHGLDEYSQLKHVMVKPGLDL
ncbi:aldehyde dehydrogenase family protein [Arthrobacter sp. OV608]|uniref:aldehyde dehydrogenase family protein n=1 Tax=Arthrobacter sp. OV608 TaxID=1882768 RepID=UPI0008B8D3BF|nr:aldehyde dehydrogenase family protein [Arthrobacter sp. OV608]SER13278.1 betaine-aldehyde dehydrogenase/aminobutyraldehyde dehydrogenase [Arthrobacter sp. OV608]